MTERLQIMAWCIVAAVCAGPAGAAVIGVPSEYGTVADAVAAAQPGDVIKLAPGVYTESVVVDKPLTIKGSDRDSTIITCGTGEGEVAVDVQADVLIEHLTVGPAGTCIKAAAGVFLRVNDLLITGGKEDGIGFAGSAQTRLYMTDCEVTECGDGVDLESTQGRALRCNFHDNHDDGLDYDGNAGFLCVSCRFVDNGDDGIEVRLASRAEVVLVGCSFRGNPEDNLELINTPELNPKDNVVIVTHCRFEGAGRWDIGAVDLYNPDGSRNEETSVEPAHAALYLCANEYTRPLEQALAPNVLVAHHEAGAPPASVTVQWTPAGGEPQDVVLAPSVPVCAGFINTFANFAGGGVGDAEGLAIDARCIYVGDDSGRPPGRVHCLDRATGALLATVSTNPFEGTEVRMTGPEGLTMMPDGNVLVLDDQGDKGAGGAIVTPGPDGFGRFVRSVNMPQPHHAAEGITLVGQDTLYLPELERVGIKACSLSQRAVKHGWPVSYLFDGVRRHLAGLGYDGTSIVVSVTAYPPARPNQNDPVPGNWLLRVSPEDGRPVGIEWIGAFLNDARGVACADGLTYVSDGWSHRKREGGFLDTRGQKVMIFAPDVAAAEAINRLPVRHQAASGG